MHDTTKENIMQFLTMLTATMLYAEHNNIEYFDAETLADLNAISNTAYRDLGILGMSDRDVSLEIGARFYRQKLAH